jgi:hypothetical protein
MAKVFLVNPRRSGWDHEAISRVRNAWGGEKGEHMAHHKHRGHHHRRNPGAMDLIWGVGGAAGGFLLTNPVASMLAPSGLLNYGAQGAIALGGGYLLGKFKKPLGWGFAVGGLASLAIKLYSDFAAPGMSGLVSTDVPTSDFAGAQGSWSSLPAYSGAAPSVVPSAGSSAAPAVAAKTGGSVLSSSSRLGKSRLGLS